MNQLFIDKYRPTDSDSYLFHNNILNNLIKIAKKKQVLNTIFYGPPSSGKNTLLKSFLLYFYNMEHKKNIFYSTKYITTSIGNTEIKYIKNNYFYEIDAYEQAFNDKKILSEFIIELSKNSNVSNNSFKIIIIKNSNYLSLDCQYALRRIMESLQKVSRIIFLTNNLSKIDDSIKSRCLLIRVPYPSKEDLHNLISHVVQKENIQLTDELKSKIIFNSGMKIDTLLTMLQFYNINNDEKIIFSSYLNIIHDIIDKLNSKDILTIREIRNKLYDLLIMNISSSTIFSKTLEILMKKKSYKHIIDKIIESICIYDNNSKYGYRDIYHLETFFVYLVKLINNYAQPIHTDLTL